MFNESSSVFALYLSIPSNPPCSISISDRMKINDLKMATPIEEKIDQNLKVSLIDCHMLAHALNKKNLFFLSNEKDAFLQVRTGMIMVSDGKSKPELARLHLTMEVITLQRPEQVHSAISPTAAMLSSQLSQPPLESKERMVQITRQKEGGLGLSIKGGAEHKLPILISRIYKDHAADRTGKLFVGDAIIKVNGEYITACNHDDAVNILRNAGDIVVLTVKHYRAATPFLQKQREFELPLKERKSLSCCLAKQNLN